MTHEPSPAARKVADTLIDTLERHGATATIRTGDREVTVGGRRDQGALPPTDPESGEILDAEIRSLPADGISGHVTDRPNDRPFVPPDAQFENEEQEFLPAKEIATIGDRLIARFDELCHVADARVEYRWKRDGGESGGRQTFGMCVKLGGLAKHFGRCDFVVWIAANHVREARFTNYQLEALIYHELTHIQYEVTKQGLTKWVIRGHDIETFAAEIQRYGAWLPSLERNREAWNQLAIGANS